MDSASTTSPGDSLRVQIRAATSEDLECIVEYNMRLAIESEHKILDRDTLRQGVLALLQDQSKGRYFVAVHKGEVIGQLMHTREWSDWRNGDIWWLQSVYIAAPYRRMGVFRRLYQHLWNEAQSSSDVVGVRLYVEVENLAAHETYRNMGLIQPGYFVMENLSKSMAVRGAGKAD